MFRSAARRLSPAISRRRYGCSPLIARSLSNVNPLRYSTSAASGATPTSESTSTAWDEGERARARQSHASRTASSPTAHYEEEQARVLSAALQHVNRLGWSEAAIMAGAREVGVSPSMVGSFLQKEAALVEFFMDECLQRLIDMIKSGEDLRNMTPSECIAKLVRIRLEMQAPYMSKWVQALSIQAQPLNAPTSFKQRAMLMDEIWHAAGDDSTNIDWYLSRTALGGICSATELYMLTDTSPDFCDTWAFLSERTRDAYDLKKTVQEAKYLAEAVSTGMGRSFQGFVKGLFQR